MNSKKSVLALTVILATGLAACSKHSSKGIKAQAEVAKATGSKEDQAKVYDKAENEVTAESNKLSENGVKLGTLGYVKSFFKSIAPEKRAPSRKSLNKTIELAETQIGLAKKMGDADKQAHAEETKKNAQEALDILNAEEAKDKTSSDEAKNNFAL